MIGIIGAMEEEVNQLKAVMKEVMFRYIKTTNMLISDLLSQVGNLILPILQSALKHSRILNLVILMN